MAVRKHPTDDQRFEVLIPSWADGGHEAAFTAWLALRGITNPSYEERLELEGRDWDAARALYSELDRLQSEFHDELCEAAINGTDEFTWLRERSYPFERGLYDMDGSGRGWVAIHIPDRNHAFQFRLQAELVAK